MSRPTHHLSKSVRELVRQADQGRCAYCQTAEANTGTALTIDHVQPVSRGGTDGLENLCQCCRTCNEFKAGATVGTDPVSGEQVALFHPRHELWDQHFVWSTDGTTVIGLTGSGRATVVTLRMNHVTIVGARRRWVLAGWHPPISP